MGTEEAASALTVLSIENPIFRNYLFYVPLLLAKLVFLSFWTARHRIPNKAFPALEDYRGAKDAEKRISEVCEPVERTRKALLNDLENIIPFILASLLYMFISPDPETALLHFRIFTGARFVHTIAYVNAIPQPARGLSWMIGYAVIWSLLGQLLYHGFQEQYY